MGDEIFAVKIFFKHFQCKFFFFLNLQFAFCQRALMQRNDHQSQCNRIAVLHFRFTFLICSGKYFKIVTLQIY